MALLYQKWTSTVLFFKNKAYLKPCPDQFSLFPGRNKCAHGNLPYISLIYTCLNILMCKYTCVNWKPVIMEDMVNILKSLFIFRKQIKREEKV